MDSKFIVNDRRSIGRRIPMNSPPAQLGSGCTSHSQKSKEITKSFESKLNSKTCQLKLRISTTISSKFLGCNSEKLISDRSSMFCLTIGIGKFHSVLTLFNNKYL